MTDETIVACVGLPDSGKTTLLAALWDQLDDESQAWTKDGEPLQAGYLRAMAENYRKCTIVGRNAGQAMQVVEIPVKSDTGRQTLRWPDVAGEEFRDLWHKGEATSELLGHIRDARHVLLLIRIDQLHKPAMIVSEFDDAIPDSFIGIAEKPANVPETGSRGALVEVASLGRAPEAASVSITQNRWSTDMLPTDVSLVLGMKRLSELASLSTRFTLVLTCWDTHETSENPEAFLRRELPLADAYIRGRQGQWSVVAISAQGGDYGSDRERLLKNPYDRARIYTGKSPSGDLTRLLD